MYTFKPRHLLIVLSIMILSTHIHAMKKEAKSIDTFDLSILLTRPNKVLDHIAQFLPFHDYETEEEFIERTRLLHIKTVSEVYTHKHIASSDIKYAAYSSDNARIIVSEQLKESDMEIVNNKIVMPKLIAIDRCSKQYEEYCIGRTHQNLAISRSTSWFATLYPESILDTSTKRIINKYSLVMTKLALRQSQNYDIPTSLELCDQHPTIAFNKQDTHIIVHGKNGEYKIFPMPHIAQNSNAQKKTLSQYFRQRGVCKDLTTQLIEKNSAICHIF